MPIRTRCLLLLLLPAFGVGQTPFPLPPVADAAALAARLPRTAALLRDDGEVRVLVYGQSISMQDWWKTVRSFLRETYPEARLVMENRAIGGFSTERLKLTVDNDVVSFYPDLILLHDYGNEPDYERIIQIIRRRTTAEIAVQTDHVAVGQNDAWHDKHSDWLRQLAEKHQLAVLDLRSAWKTYLATNNLPASALLSDNVHLNGHGNALMAGLVNRYFANLPEPRVPAPTVRTLAAGDFTVYKNRLRLRVRGTRVDLLFDSTDARSGSVRVLFDGKKPSEWPSTYFYTRPALQPEGFFLRNIGQVLAIELGTKPQAEDWALTVVAVDSLRQQLRFRLRGSRTGDDGAGSSDTAFVSNSGRIRIAPESWFRRKNADDFRQFSWLKPGDVLRWRVFSASRNEVQPAESAVVTVVQGVANGEHELILSGKGLSALRGIRVYEPPLPP